MSIQLIDKIKQKNDGNFYLVDAVDVEYNKKSLIDALKAGDIIPAGGGTSAGTFHVANINIGSNTAFDSSKLTPSTVSAGDLIVDANGAFYTVAKVDGTTVTPSAALTAASREPKATRVNPVRRVPQARKARRATRSPSPKPTPASPK